MLSYPKIPYTIRNDIEIIAFDKLDGSNIQAAWDWEAGFYEFGTRFRRFDADDRFGETITLIQETYADPMRKIFLRNGVAKATCFFEYFGASSFAGNHKPSEEHKVILIDVCISNPYAGFVAPEAFIKFFKDVPTPVVLYKGIATPEFLESVENGTLPGMTFEGVVCKGREPGDKKTIVRFKWKNKAWVEALKAKCNGDKKLFLELL